MIIVLKTEISKSEGKRKSVEQTRKNTQVEEKREDEKKKTRVKKSVLTRVVSLLGKMGQGVGLPTARQDRDLLTL